MCRRNLIRRSIIGRTVASAGAGTRCAQQAVPLPGVGQVGRGHPPGLADRLLAAGHGHIAEVGRPAKAAVIARQELAAPDRAVGAEASAVERHADDRLDQTIVGHATGHVRVVMLDGEPRDRRVELARA